jgi:hypothetical protein
MTRRRPYRSALTKNLVNDTGVTGEEGIQENEPHLPVLAFCIRSHRKAECSKG